MAVLTLPSTGRLRSALTGRTPFEPAATPAYLLLALMAALTFVLAGWLGFEGDHKDMPTVTAALAMFILFAMLFRWRNSPRIATAIEAMVLVLAVSIAVECLCVVLATTAFPYQDALLERADALLLPGFRWMDMYTALHNRAPLITLMCMVYGTLRWQPFALVAVLALTGRELACWRFVRSWFLALIACVAIFPFVPAVGTYVYHGLKPADIPALTSDVPWRQFQVLGSVRDGSLRTLELMKMTGIVSFPSFHAAGAVLLFWGFRQVRVIGPAFMALNVAMCLTAPLIGAHYFTDIIGGIGIALLAIAATRPATTATFPQAHP